MNNAKTILVIGATSGIGSEICKFLIKDYCLIITGRNKEALDKLSDSLGSDNCDAYLLDVTVEEEVQDLISKIEPVDGMVFCAGISEHTPAKFIKRKHFEKTFEVNLFSPITVTSVLLKSNKINKIGSLVYLSSASTRYPYYGGSLYVASKSALEGYVRTLALELTHKKIRANTVCPVFVETKMIDFVQSILDEGRMDDYVKKHPFAKIEVEDVVGTVAYLISDNSKTVTGQSIMIGNLD